MARSSFSDRVSDLATEANGLPCEPHRDCSYQDDTRRSWPRAARDSWCRSCLVHWHLCEADRHAPNLSKTKKVS